MSRQFGFWDPRSDDDNLIVTTVHYDDELLIVGFQGGLALLFTINNQSANVSIEVCVLTVTCLLFTTLWQFVVSVLSA